MTVLNTANSGLNAYDSSPYLYNAAGEEALREIKKSLASEGVAVREQLISYYASTYYLEVSFGDKPEIVTDSQNQILFRNYEGMVSYLQRWCDNHDKLLNIQRSALEKINKLRKEEPEEKYEKQWKNDGSLFQKVCEEGAKQVADTFAEINLKEKVEKLRVLSDDSYKALCVKMNMMNTAQVVAMFHVLEIDKHTATYINKHKGCGCVQIFESDNKMYSFISKAFGKHSTPTLQKEFPVVDGNGSTESLSKYKSHMFVSECEEMYDSLK